MLLQGGAGAVLLEELSCSLKHQPCCLSALKQEADGFGVHGGADQTKGFSKSRCQGFHAPWQCCRDVRAEGLELKPAQSSSWEEELKTDHIISP